LSDALQHGLGERFFYYAKRIQFLDLDEIDASDSDAESPGPVQFLVDPRLLFLWTAATPAPLPRLREITFSGRHLSSSPYAASMIHALLRSPMLDSLCLTIDQDSIRSVQAELRHELLELAPRLRKLYVNARLYAFNDGLEGLERWTELVGEMIARTESLRDCILHLPATLSDLHALSRMRHLRQLQISHLATAEGFQHPFSFPEGALSKLARVRLTDDSERLPLARTVLSTPSSGCMKHILIRADTETSVDHVCNTVSLLAKHLSLTYVAMDFPSPIHGDARVLFEALPSLPRLERLDMRLCSKFGTDPPLISAILLLYPNLQSFRLKSYGRPGLNDLPTLCPVSLTQLVHIIRAHPELTKLPVYINTSELPQFPAAAELAELRYGPRLRVLASADCPETRRAIAELLPKVTELVLVKASEGARVVGLRDGRPRLVHVTPSLDSLFLDLY
jgi:hypothetical protein